MDKLRAIHYFNQAVELGSLSAAARFFDVSTPSVTQLVGALEASLGVALLHRTHQGVAPTAEGERYYETSRRIATDLRELELRMAPRAAALRGTLTVGMRDAVGQTCVMPRIVRFLERHPAVDLTLRPVTKDTDVHEKDVDLTLQIGWPSDRDLVVRPLLQTRHLVVASPGYWARHGRPETPENLRPHDCLVVRSTGGTQLDRWTFEREGVRQSVDVRSRLFSDERNWLYEAAGAGAGVARLADVTLIEHVETGTLAVALSDWVSLEAPMIFASYRPGMRRSRLVRAFVDFLVEIFAELDVERAPLSGNAPERVPRPAWFGRAHGRHSAYVARRSSSGTA